MEGTGDVAEIELGLDLSARAKSKGFLKKNAHAEVPPIKVFAIWGLRITPYEWPKCKEFFRKSRHSRDHFVKLFATWGLRITPYGWPKCKEFLKKSIHSGDHYIK